MVPSPPGSRLGIYVEHLRRRHKQCTTHGSPTLRRKYADEAGLSGLGFIAGYSLQAPPYSDWFCRGFAFSLSFPLGDRACFEALIVSQGLQAW